MAASGSLDRRADRGDVYATRRHRFVNTLVYDLPFGRGRKLMSASNRFIDGVFGGWRVSLDSDPSIGSLPDSNHIPRRPLRDKRSCRGTQRPDRVGAASGEVSDPTRNLWVDRNAFVAPGRVPGASNQFDFNVGVRPGQDPAPIGRFGNSGVGIIQGPERSAGTPECEAFSRSPKVSICNWKAVGPTCRTGRPRRSEHERRR